MKDETLLNSHTLPDQPWTRSHEETLRALDVRPDAGLSADEVRRRQDRYGPNRLRDAETRSVWSILAEQFKNLLTALLAIAAILSFAFGELVEGVAIGAVILINAAIGFFTELRAVRSMEALQQMTRVDAKVRREGQVREIPAEQIVPGDVVVLESGDVVTADLRLFEASKLQTDESALTGESTPVSKALDPIEADTPLAERANMVFKGTAVTRGSGEGVAVAVGMESELGEISSLVESAEEETTPLEERLDQLGRNLVWVTLGILTVVTITGALSGRDLLFMIETAIALAVATVPEGLPIVATIALARGMRRMAERNALINRLSAVETLGATNVILTDKTGTLTENRMTVTRIALETGEVSLSGQGLDTQGKFSLNGEQIDPQEHDLVRRTLEVGVLCNNATLPEGEPPEESTVGDPTEIALLVAGEKAGLRREALLEDAPEVREVAFDTDTKMMATFHQNEQAVRVAVKGAPEAVLDSSHRLLTGEGPRDLSEDERKRWREKSTQLARDGLRVLAMAQKEVDQPEAEPYQELTFLGVVGLLDPPREDVQAAIDSCREAGIKVIMVTGDQPETARNVGASVGLHEPEEEERIVRGREFEEVGADDRSSSADLLETPIFARVTPRQKLDLVAAYQEEGAIVAMTGDGVNDAPALKKADIGIAMGRRGTQVAREAADMVLKDDAFSTIVVAVEQGRVIFSNIRKFVLYLLSCNMSEIAVISLATLASAPLPIRPLQILFLNLVTDVFPALALGVGEGEEAVMGRPPRDPEEPVLTRRHWGLIGGYSLLISAAVLIAFAAAYLWLDLGEQTSVSVSFLTLASAQLWHVFNMRTPGSSILNNEVTRNPYVWGALALCAGLLAAAVYFPPLASVLDVVRPGRQGWALALGLSLAPLVIGQIYLSLPFHRK